MSNFIKNTGASLQTPKLRRGLGASAQIPHRDPRYKKTHWLRPIGPLSCAVTGPALALNATARIKRIIYNPIGGVQLPTF